jgi:hypothetical protein
MGDVDMLEGDMNIFSSGEGEGVKFVRGTDGAIESGDRHRRTYDRTHEADRLTAGETKSTSRFVKLHSAAPLRLAEFCSGMIGGADIEGSKSNVAMNAWLPQASYPCGNFSGTSPSRLAEEGDGVGTGAQGTGRWIALLACDFVHGFRHS